MVVVSTGHLNLKVIKEQREEDKLEIIIIKIDIKIAIDKTVVIGECHIEVKLSMGKIIEEGHGMIKITEVILGNEILEIHKIATVKTLEVDIEVALGVTILEDVKVGLEKDSIHVTLGGMIEVAVDQDEVQVQLPIEIELDALNEGSMITLLKIVQIYQKQKKSSQSRYSRCLT